MGVSTRKNHFIYRFRYDGKPYYGSVPGTLFSEKTTPAQMARLHKVAQKYEFDLRQKLLADKEFLQRKEDEIRKNKSVRALVENYRFELSGGHPITLEEAFDLALEKPSRKQPTAAYLASRRSRWNDFLSYVRCENPQVLCLTDVTRPLCEKYVQYLIQNGCFVKVIEYCRDRQRKRRKRGVPIAYHKQKDMLSPATIKQYVSTAKWVFGKLMEDAGLVTNPWTNVILPEQTHIPREIFTDRELHLIWEGLQTNPFCYPLFVVAANSGMTEGDICTLRWDEVDFASGYIRRTRRKTGASITLPLLPALADYLWSLPRLGEYVFPEHANLYLNQSSEVSVRVKDFLNGLGISTTVEVKGRRAVSVKDLHSMRHVFCYRAKRAGIPESVIMKFVGHKVLAMTQHYSDHDTEADLRLEMQKLPRLFDEGAEGDEGRKRLASLAYALPTSAVNAILEKLKELEPQAPTSLPLLPLP